MTQLLSRRITLSVFCAFGLLVGGARAQATDISGTISTTKVIYDDSELTGDVTCAVPPTVPGPNPCISLGADHITLRLNGHRITGPVTPPTGCSHEVDAMFGVGIAVLDRSDVKIEGPGIIQHFERWGILVGFPGHPNTEVTVKKVTADHNCWSGMQTFSTTDSNFEENVFTSDSSGSNGANCGGT
jgi:hypothetical protein